MCHIIIFWAVYGPAVHCHFSAYGIRLFTSAKAHAPSSTGACGQPCSSHDELYHLSSDYEDSLYILTVRTIGCIFCRRWNYFLYRCWFSMSTTRIKWLWIVLTSVVQQPIAGLYVDGGHWYDRDAASYPHCNIHLCVLQPSKCVGGAWRTQYSQVSHLIKMSRNLWDRYTACWMQ